LLLFFHKDDLLFLFIIQRQMYSQLVGKFEKKRTNNSEAWCFI